jgi:uncharacterized membrane protein
MSRAASFVVAYVVSLTLFVVIDLLWLTAMAGAVYRPALGDIAASAVNLVPAALFYLVYPIGVMIFVVVPALKSGNLRTSLLYGALFGFSSYATYDLTNHATLRNWTTQLTVIDIAWGCWLTAVAAAAGYWTARRTGVTA